MFTTAMWALELVLGAATTAQAPPAAQALPAALYPSAAAAVQALLEQEPRVVGFGEYHQKKSTAAIRSALKRFTYEILPTLQKAGATDLVVETWITTGSCGEVEKKAVSRVDHTTERPRTTENEVLTLLFKAKQAEIVPRILEVACKDYQAIFETDQLDYDKLLRITRDQLDAQIRKALGRAKSRLVFSYGGALHNDLYPQGELAPYAFGETIAEAVEGRYLEVDLVVPEYVERDTGVREQAWYQEYLRARKPRKVVLIEKGKGAYVLVFPRSETGAKKKR